jgi:hypothetical protein
MIALPPASVRKGHWRATKCRTAGADPERRENRLLQAQIDMAAPSRLDRVEERFAMPALRSAWRAGKSLLGRAGTSRPAGDTITAARIVNSRASPSAARDPQSQQHVGR